MGKAWTLLLLPLLTILPIFASVSQYTVRDLSLIVYSDGQVRVRENIDFNSTQAIIAIPTLGNLLTDVIVKNENGTLLVVRYDNGLLTIELQSSNTAAVGYTTSNLTSKNGYRWSLRAETRVPVTIKLPDSSTIV